MSFVPPLTLGSSYRGFIQVAVGEGDQLQTFDVHEDIITARSPFFKKAMSGDWKEAQDRLVKLPDDNPAIFQLYVHLLYTNMLAVVPDPLPPNYTGSNEHVKLAKLYVLAEKLQDIDTKNTVLEAMLLATRQTRSDGKCYYPGNGPICLIYAGTVPGSPMRKLLVDFYTYQAEANWLSESDETWPTEFTHELAIKLLDKREAPIDPTRTGDASRYMEVKDKTET
jgi:hypothetical protein